MKSILCCLIIICSTVYSGDIPGLYKCKTVFVEQYRNGSISRKRISVKSLYLNITRNKISIFGVESGRSICKDLPVDQISMDTLFVIPRLKKNNQNRARLYFKKDTLAGDYNFLDNNAYDSVAIKILISKASQGMLDRLVRQCR